MVYWGDCRGLPSLRVRTGERTVNGITTKPQTDEETRTRRVPPYHVILLNDDHHSMQFVVEVLCKAARLQRSALRWR